jgi:hypothetical protein
MPGTRASAGAPMNFKLAVHVELLETLGAQHLVVGGSERSLEDGVLGWLVHDPLR